MRLPILMDQKSHAKYVMSPGLSVRPQHRDYPLVLQPVRRQTARLFHPQATHPLCTGAPPRETRVEDLSMLRIKMQGTEDVWAPQNHIGGRDSPDVEWLETLETPTPLLAHRPWRPALSQVPEQEKPTNSASDHEPYDTVPRGRVSLRSELADNWGLSAMNIGGYRAVTVALSACLPFFFGWLVGDADWAMRIVRGAHVQ